MSVVNSLYKKKQGFTLIELLIVVLIMGVVYKLALHSFTNLKQFQKGKLLSLSSLKQQLSQYDFETKARVVCYNDCSTCKIILDGKKELSIDPFLKGKRPVSYRYDDEVDEFIEKEIEPYYDKGGIEHMSCFSFRIFKNGSSQQIYVQEGKKVYWLGDYFTVLVYDSLEAAKNDRIILHQKALL